MKKILLMILILSFCLSMFAQNQSSGFQSTNNNSAYMYSGTMTGTDQLKIKAYIWGQVRKPGLYIVPDNIDLLALISLAGGPTENAKLTKIKIIRPTTDGSKKVIPVNMQKYMETGDEELIPVMRPGDTVVVSGTLFYAFTKFAEFLSKVAVGVGLWISIDNISN